MKISDRVVDCIMYVIEELKIQELQIEEIGLLSQFLEEQGYSENDIEDTIPWFLSKNVPYNIDNIKSSQANHHSKTFRILTKIEKMAITPKAHGYLIQLLEFDLINNVDFEHILEKAVSLGFKKIGILEIEAITSAVLLDMDKIPQGTFYHYEYSTMGH